MPSPPPAIGSHRWDRELRSLGVLRADLDLLHALAMFFAAHKRDTDRAHDTAYTDEDDDAVPPTFTGHDVTLAPDSVIAWVDRIEASADGCDPLWLRVCEELLIGAESWTALERLRNLVDAHRRAVRGDDSEGLDEYLVLHVANWLLFHDAYPGYHAMMHLRYAYFDLRDRSHLADWFVRQLAAMMVHGNRAVIESVDYSLGVDFFEDDRDAVIVLPRLLPLVTQDHRDAILARSGYIVWEAKCDFYRALINRPGSHEALARALRDSLFSVFYGSVEMRAAFDLFQELKRQQPSLTSLLTWRDLRIGFTLPVLAWVKSVICAPAPQAIPSWGERPPPDALVALAFESYQKGHPPTLGSIPSWFDRGELYLDDQRWAVVHTVRYSHTYDSPFLRSTPPEHTQRTAELDALRPEDQLAPDQLSSDVQWHAVTMIPGCSPRSLLGRITALWPEGMYALRQQLPARRLPP